MNIFLYFLEVSLCWLFFYAFYHFFLRKETFFQINRFYLLSVVGLGLILPLSLPVFKILFETNISFIPTYSVNLNEIAFTETIETNITNSFQFSWVNLILSIYLIGVLARFFQFAKSINQLIQLKKKSHVIENKGFLLIKTTEITMPFSFINWLFLPQNHQVSPQDEAKIIEHELVHIQSQHSLDILLIEVLSILFWFNPLLLLFHQALKEVHEYAADQVVLRSVPVKNYGRMLLQQAFPDIELRLVHNFNQSQLKKRIKMMTKKPSSKRALLKYAFIAPMLLGLAFLFSAYQLAPISIEQNGDPIYDKVDQMPTWKGCETEENALKCTYGKIINLLVNNLEYPKAAKEKNIEGKVLLEFIVSKEGQVKQLKIKKDLAGGCGQAAFQAANKMIEDKVQWNAGIKNDKKVAVRMVLPVAFKLPKEEK